MGCLLLIAMFGNFLKQECFNTIISIGEIDLKQINSDLCVACI